MNNESDDNNEEKIWKLIANKLSGEATEEELGELLAMINDDSGIAELYKILENFWNYTELQIKCSDDDIVSEIRKRKKKDNL